MLRLYCVVFFFFFSSRRRHTRLQGDWSSDVCSSDLGRRNRPSNRTKKLTKKKDGLRCLNFLTKKAPYKGLGADSEEKREPVSDINTAVVDSLKVLDLKWPIREADIRLKARHRLKKLSQERLPGG